MSKIDLHIHTNCSDGDFSVQEVINLSKKNNCDYVSITDHEYIQDYSELSVLNKINILSGIEFNTSHKGLHILGYGIDKIDEMQKYMSCLHRDNESKTIELIYLLKSKGIDISVEKLKMFLYQANLKYEYLDKRHVVKYLIYYGITNDVYDTYKNLIGRGTDLYIPLKKISPREIFDKVHECGGVAVIAHPFTLNYDDKELYNFISQLKDEGLDGIEIINGRMPVELQPLYEKISDEFNLLRTVGSDFHNMSSSNIGIDYKYDIIDKLNEKIKIRQRTR